MGTLAAAFLIGRTLPPRRDYPISSLQNPLPVCLSSILLRVRSWHLHHWLAEDRTLGFMVAEMCGAKAASCTAVTQARLHFVSKTPHLGFAAALSIGNISNIVAGRCHRFRRTTSSTSAPLNGLHNRGRAELADAVDR